MNDILQVTVAYEAGGSKRRRDPVGTNQGHSEEGDREVEGGEGEAEQARSKRSRRRGPAVPGRRGRRPKIAPARGYQKESSPPPPP